MCKQIPRNDEEVHSVASDCELVLHKSATGGVSSDQCELQEESHWIYVGYVTTMSHHDLILSL